METAQIFKNPSMQIKIPEMRRWQHAQLAIQTTALLLASLPGQVIILQQKQNNCHASSQILCLQLVALSSSSSCFIASSSAFVV